MLKNPLINPFNVIYVANLLLMVDKSFVEPDFSPDADRLFDTLNICLADFHRPFNLTGKELPPMDDIDKRTQDLISVAEKVYNNMDKTTKEEIGEIIRKMEKFHRGKMKTTA